MPQLPLRPYGILHPRPRRFGRRVRGGRGPVALLVLQCPSRGFPSVEPYAFDPEAPVEEFVEEEA